MPSALPRLRPLAFVLAVAWIGAGCSLIGSGETVRDGRVGGQARSGQAYEDSQLRQSPWRTPRSRLPNRLMLHDDDLRLPGAELNSRGGIRALVLPIAFGEQAPAWTDTLIARHLLGSYNISSGEKVEGAAGRLARASDGLLRLDASVFPHLVDPDSLPVAAPSEPLDAGYLDHVLRAWATRVDLAPFDSDGPDGAPMSSDDDGAVDLVLLVVETDDERYLRTVDLDLALPVGKKGQKSLRVPEVHLVGLPRTAADAPQDVDRMVTRLMLRAMGLKSREMFFPVDFDRPLSTLSRLRLGWNFASFVDRSGHYELEDRHTLVVPIVDVDTNRGLWLVERDDTHLYLTRIARRADGHFDTVASEHMRYTDDTRVVPLTETEGEDGPRMRVRWPEEDLAPSISVALSAHAAEAGTDRLPGDEGSR